MTRAGAHARTGAEKLAPGLDFLILFDCFSNGRASTLLAEEERNVVALLGHL
jgi:hypothetical protein